VHFSQNHRQKPYREHPSKLEERRIQGWNGACIAGEYDKARSGKRKQGTYNTYHSVALYNMARLIAKGEHFKEIVQSGICNDTGIYFL